MFSYWEQQSFTDYDHIIIGAGIVGMSLALELKQRLPSQRILILERGYMPTGASSRNAGFACMGSVTELLDDLTRTSETEMIQLFALRKQGLEKLRHRLGDDVISYRENGSYELIDSSNLAALDHLERLNNLLLPVTGKPAFRRADGQIEACGFDKNFTRAMIENTCEGELNTGKMLRALTDHCLQAGIEIKTGAYAERFEETETGVIVYVPDQLRQDHWSLRCRTLSVCTNAFAPQLLPGETVTPGRGQVLITKPIPGLRFKGIYHFDDGYYYFRELDGRVLFGGGRNLDFEGETTTALELQDNIQLWLERWLRKLILPGLSFEIEQRWSGIMAFGPTKMPIVKQCSAHVYGAFRMGGMGVALGSQAAFDLANIICM